MKHFWGWLFAVIATALSALIVLAFEDEAKALFNDKPVTAHVYIAPWYPYPKGDEGDPSILMRGQGLTEQGVGYLVSNDDATYAAILVKNRGLNDVSNVRIQYRGIKPFISSVDGKVFRRDSEEVMVPLIRAGGTVRINVWSLTDLNPDFVFIVKIFSDGKNIPVEYHRSENWGSLSYDEPEWFYELEKWLPRAIFAIIVGLLIITIILAIHSELYIKRLFKDEGIYISERLRYESNPAKFKVRLEDPPTQ